MSRGKENKHTHPSANKPSPKQNHSLPTVTRTQKNSPELSNNKQTKPRAAAASTSQAQTPLETALTKHTHPPRTITTTTRRGEAPAEGKKNKTIAEKFFSNKTKPNQFKEKINDAQLKQSITHRKMERATTSEGQSQPASERAKVGPGAEKGSQKGSRSHWYL